MPSYQGLQNFGNTCWFNAVISALSVFDVFMEAVYDDLVFLESASPDIKSKPEYQNCYKFLSQLFVVLNGAKNADTNVNDDTERCINEFINVYRQFTGKFQDPKKVRINFKKIGQVEDAVEFFNEMLRHLKRCTLFQDRSAQSKTLGLFDNQDFVSRTGLLAWSTEFYLAVENDRDIDIVRDFFIEFVDPLPPLLCLVKPRREDSSGFFKFPESFDNSDRTVSYQLKSFVCAKPSHFISYTKKGYGWLRRDDSEVEYVGPKQFSKIKNEVWTKATMAFYEKTAAAPLSRIPSAPPPEEGQSLTNYPVALSGDETAGSKDTRPAQSTAQGQSWTDFARSFLYSTIGAVRGWTVEDSNEIKRQRIAEDSVVAQIAQDGEFSMNLYEEDIKLLFSDDA